MPDSFILTPKFSALAKCFTSRPIQLSFLNFLTTKFDAKEFDKKCRAYREAE